MNRTARSLALVAVSAVIVAFTTAGTARAQLAPTTAPVEEFHDYLRSRTVGVPSYTDGGVRFDPSADIVTADGAGQAVYAIQLDGGMRPRFLSVEARGPGIDPTAIMLDHASGTKRTRSGLDAQSAAWHWIDIPLAEITGVAGNKALPRASQAVLNLRVEFSAKSGETRRVVLFYDRPTVNPTSVPFPDFPPGTIGDLARLLTF